MNILARLKSLLPKPTYVDINGKPMRLKDMNRESDINIKEIIRLSKTKQWQDHVKRLHSDHKFLEEETKRFNNIKFQ